LLYFWEPINLFAIFDEDQKGGLECHGGAREGQGSSKGQRRPRTTTGS